MGSATILVVEDEPAIRRGIIDALTFAGYRTVECGDGLRAAKLACEGGVDMVLLDVMLPGKDGFAVLSEIRGLRPGLPVMLVTARGSEEDRVRGLNSGGDDYVVKPFSAKELLARVAALLRRSESRPLPVKRLRAGQLQVDLQRCTITGGDTKGDLTPHECDVLQYLAGRPDRSASRDELLLAVWGLDPKGLQTRVVDMQIARLREKLGGTGGEVEVIETVRGRGYRLGAGVKLEVDL